MKREQQLKRLSLSGLAAGLLLLVVPEQAFAMHIMEGFLPPLWALAWWMLFFTLPVVRAGASAPYRGGRQ